MTEIMELYKWLEIFRKYQTRLVVLSLSRRCITNSSLAYQIVDTMTHLLCQYLLFPFNTLFRMPSVQNVVTLKMSLIISVSLKFRIFVFQPPSQQILYEYVILSMISACCDDYPQCSFFNSEKTSWWISTLKMFL